MPVGLEPHQQSPQREEEKVTAVDQLIKTAGTLQQAVAEYARGRTYFQIAGLRQSLVASGYNFKEGTLKKYLYRLKKAGALFGAGRGWYSTVAYPFVLDKKPLNKIVKLISEQFPLLTFCAWSTAQLQSYFHHLPGRHLVFIYSEKDALATLYEFLREKYRDCYLNPKQREVEQTFRLMGDTQTVLLRPAVSEAPAEGAYAKIEKILVDLLVEHSKLDLFDRWEYEQLFQKLIRQYRIEMAARIRYAGRRRAKEKIRQMIH